MKETEQKIRIGNLTYYTRLTLSVVLCLGGLACTEGGGTKASSSLATLRMTAAGKNTVFFHTQNIRVSILDAKLNDGDVTCDQIKDRVYGVDLDNIDVLEQVDREWNGSQPEEIIFEDVDVPFDKPVLIVVEGLAKIGESGVIHVVGRGCEEATFVEDSLAGQSTGLDPLQGITVQLSATAGLGCQASANRCEPNFQCTGGFCLRDSCDAANACPPGTYCIQGACRKSCGSGSIGTQGSSECPASAGFSCQLASAADGNCEAACLPGTSTGGC